MCLRTYIALVISLQMLDAATSFVAELHSVGMKIPKDSALLDLLSGTISIETRATGFLKGFLPQTTHHDDGDVKTTKGVKGNIGLSNAKPTLSVEGSIARERQRKGQAINFTSNRCG